MFFDEPQMLFLGLNKQEHQAYSRNKIEYNKKISILQGQARQEAKLSYCYYCKKKCRVSATPILFRSFVLGELPPTESYIIQIH